MQRRAISARVLARLACFVTVVTLSVTVHADVSYLIDALQNAPSFRVRVQSALSLAQYPDEPGAVTALAGALHDEHPAVRMAAASSMGRLGHRDALVPLFMSLNDSNEGVRRAAEVAVRQIKGITHYYVAVGAPGTSIPNLNANLVNYTREEIERGVALIDGVALAPRERNAAVERGLLQAQRWKAFHLDSSIVELASNEQSTKVAVSMVLSTYPDHVMRAMWKTSAQATAFSSARAQTVALQAAIERAVDKLTGTLARVASGG